MAIYFSNFEGPGKNRCLPQKLKKKKATKYQKLLKCVRMQADILKKPNNMCYVIKRPIPQTLFSITRGSNGHKAVVAFRYKEQAQTFKRLMLEMGGGGGGDRAYKGNNVVVERDDLDLLSKRCALFGLDLIVYNGDTYMVHSACDYVNKDVVAVFENMYNN